MMRYQVNNIIEFLSIEPIYDKILKHFKGDVVDMDSYIEEQEEEIGEINLMEDICNEVDGLSHIHTHLDDNDIYENDYVVVGVS
jgi:hypothetical protein